MEWNGPRLMRERLLPHGPAGRAVIAVVGWFADLLLRK